MKCITLFVILVNLQFVCGRLTSSPNKSGYSKGLTGTGEVMVRNHIAANGVTDGEKSTDSTVSEH